MVNLARVIAQVAIVGSQIVGRAFIEAYKQAAAGIIPLLLSIFHYTSFLTD